MKNINIIELIIFRLFLDKLALCKVVIGNFCPQHVKVSCSTRTDSQAESSKH
ncbi:MAG: hypothetical protein ACI9U5_001974 [Colwellia sp.]